MTCVYCGGPLPCYCFQRRADEETERLALTRFAAGEQPLFLARSGHLLPSRSYALTLCRKKRLNEPSATVIDQEAVRKGVRWCEQCYAKALRALDRVPA